MKTPLKLIITCIAVITLGAIVTRSVVTQAQEPQVQIPTPVVVHPNPVQYRVIDIGKLAVVKGLTPSGTLEAVLNEMGAQGWRVVSVSGALVILMQ